MAATSSQTGNLMALDVGTVRIGVALASAVARFPHPIATIQNNDDVWETLKRLCTQDEVSRVVVGLPRGLDGQETSQTQYCRTFADKARTQLGVDVVLQDEALTSLKAESELKDRKRTQTTKGEIDALAATYILEDYLSEQG